MIKHKSTLAKLLAKENITVQYGNYQTAWFDIKNRVLGIPLWKDMGSDVNDLFIGHEVGHALFTPYEGWHDSPEKLEGCPRSYINVIEDARIERHIKDSYAGLVGPMARGYKKLWDDGFFGKEFHSLDWDEVKLIDKINLKAKVGLHLDVPMNDEEIVYYNRSMQTQTFEEVLDLVRDILAYTKENQEDLLTPPAAQQTENGQEESDDMGPTGHDDMETKNDETETGGDQEQDSIDETDEEGKDSAKGKTSKSNDDDDRQGNVEDQKPADEDVSQTDENFRRKEHTLLDRNDDGTQTLIGNEFSKPIRDKIVIPYSELKAQRKTKLDEFNKIIGNSEYDQYYGRGSVSIEDHRIEFKKYLKTVKKNVNFAVKEFEMRKAAYRYTRAQTARTGSIDVNRLWSYRTNDDIFARVTQLADAKNHGMMMLIDYSGSMSECMSNVMDQLLHLVVFCKAVNIPFDVYGFTNCNPHLNSYRYEDEEHTYNIPQIESELHHSGLSLPQIVVSTLKKADYEDAIFHIYLRKVLSENNYSYNERYILAPQEDYGSTPLNQALVASHRMVDKFIKSQNIDNMNFVVISDGDTNGCNIVRNVKRDNYVPAPNYKDAILNIMGKHVNLEDMRKGGTKSLLENLQKKFGLTTIGFFLADHNNNFKYKIQDIDEEAYWDDNIKKYQREYNKNRCVTFKDALGYNEYYLLKSKRISTEAEEFEPKEDASKGQITSAFKKFSKSKKTNKTLLTNFGKAVAE